MYVEGDDGERKICPHPAEPSAISQILKINREDVIAWLTDKNAQINQQAKELLEERVGFNSKCVCFECVSAFDIDLKKDERKCPNCQSENLKSASEAVGEDCPKCHQGTIEAKGTSLIA